MILLIKHTSGWGLIFHQNQVKMNKYNIRQNSKIVYHCYEVRDEVMLGNNYAFKYETLYNRKVEITQCCTKVKVTLKRGAVKIGIVSVVLIEVPA